MPDTLALPAGDLARDLAVAEIRSTIVDDADAAAAQAVLAVGDRAELRRGRAAPGQWRGGHRRGGDAGRPALERGERREHQGRDRSLPGPGADRPARRPGSRRRARVWMPRPSATPPPNRRSRPRSTTPSAAASACPPACCSAAWCGTASVLWTLASGDPGQEIEEAEGKLAARLHRTFKVKVGAQDPAADLARLRRAGRRAGRPGGADRRRQPGLGRDHHLALPARCWPISASGWWSSRCQPGTSPAWPG